MWDLFPIFTVAECQKHEADIFNESVFALSLIENVAIFYEERTTNSTHSLFSYASSTICTCIPYYSSVGYCIVYSLQVRHNLQLDRRNQLHTFFLWLI